MATRGKARRHVFFSSDGHDRWQAWRRVEPSGAPDPHRTNSVAIAILFHRTADAPRNPSPRDRAIMAICSPEAPSDDADKTWKNPRSRSDRAMIAVRSSRDRISFLGESSPIDRQAIDEGSGPRSWPDRGPIMARSWRKSWLFGSQIEAKFTPICRGIEATIYAHGIAPSMPSNHLHDRLHCPRFRANFPL